MIRQSFINNSSDDVLGITYPVDRWKIEGAVDILHRETGITRKFQRLFVGSGLVFAGALAVSILLALVLQDGKFEFVLDIVGALVFLTAFLAGLLLMVAFVSDLAMPGVQWWYSNQLRKLGLGVIAVSDPVTTGAKVLRILGAVCGAFGIFMLLGAIGTTLFPLEDNQMVIAAIVFLAIGLLLAVLPFVNRWRRYSGLSRRLDDVTKRMTSFLAGSSSSVLNIGVDDLNFMACAEAKQIESERKEALKEAERETTSREYALRSRRRVLEETMALDPEVRIQVQDQMTMLAHNSKPLGAAWDDEARVWRVMVPDTQIQISYAIDDDKREIKLISISEPGAMSAGAEAKV